jgi:hypothetical protein
VHDAINKEIPIRVIISQSVIELFKMSESDAYKSIALIRHGFEGALERRRRR